MALDWLSDTWNAREFANIDPEEFYDFTEMRPLIHMEAKTTDKLKWPKNQFRAATAGEHELILFHGIEPHLKWRTYGDTILEVARTYGVKQIYTLQSSLADVPHTRPSKVMSYTSDPELSKVMDDQPTYEGPTGITSAFREQGEEAGISVASLWVSVPHYVGHLRAPQAALALVRTLGSHLRTPLNMTDLEAQSDAYQRQISELVAEDDDATNYVADLEVRSDAESINADELGAAAEQFLRDKW